MDSTELHYLAYDPEEIMTEMMVAYANAGGDILYAGDEKEMLLRAVQQIIVQAFAGIDNALRMATLRYAVREYLDIYGEKRGCPRISAAAARATVEIVMEATGRAGTIPAGTALTADGSVTYLTDEEVALTGLAQTLSVGITCSQEGTIGNGLLNGTAMQCLIPVDGMISVTCSESAAGGQDTESDEVYRERIRTHGLSSVTTGPRYQYESAAKAVSSEIVDARALHAGAGEVNVYIIPASETGVEALIQLVADALNEESVRPMTDHVTVLTATKKEYTISVRYAYDGSVAVQTAVGQAVADYIAWQEGAIGRAFNPDRLMAMIYQAGAQRVVFGEDCAFDGGACVYTEIGPSEYCAGSVSLAVMGE